MDEENTYTERGETAHTFLVGGIIGMEITHIGGVTAQSLLMVGRGKRSTLEEQGGRLMACWLAGWLSQSVIIVPLCE